jgi:hypothetical protein
MTTDHDKQNARLKGMEDFKAGKNFAECPNQGFREDDIELRWQWQKGWLRAQLDEKDKAHPPNFKV